MKAAGFSFEVQAQEGAARAGRLSTPNGSVKTPAFMPVATFGAVRGIEPSALRDLGAQILLTNTYHLHERPGEEVIQQLGGLHGFTGWSGPWLSDSGGYQVTSLADRMTLDEDGVTFSSPRDGSRRKLTPERVIQIQESLASDIAMVLDQCIAPEGPASGGRSGIEAAMHRTLRWAERSAASRRRPSQAVFGIVQGGTDLALRRESAREVGQLEFDGFAHGGLGLGESRSARTAAIEAAHAELAEPSPRYLMGLGRPEDLLDGIACGVDLFDCVVPTRNGRHGLVFTREGTLHLKNARFRDDPGPLDPECDCPACRHHSRAYVRHLLHSGEVLGSRLAALHNLRFYLVLMSRARRAISEGSFSSLRAEYERQDEHAVQ